MKNQLAKLTESLRAWYPFDDEAKPGKDLSGHGLDATAVGSVPPVIGEVNGRKAAVFQGGTYGASYFRLPDNLLDNVGDETGFSISAWVCLYRQINPWERIFDCGNGMGYPYTFLTRNLRGVCFLQEDLAADRGKPPIEGEWSHIVFTVTGTKGGKLSSAGPRLYLNGSLVGDGWISQTSSGTYKMLREWLSTFDNKDNYSQNFIGHSQFVADADFHGAITDFRLYSTALEEEEIVALMCESMRPDQILKLAKEKYIGAPMKIVDRDITLQTSIMDGEVQVSWKSDKPDIISPEGKVNVPQEPVGVFLTAVLSRDGLTTEKTFSVSVIPNHLTPCEMTIHGDRPTIDISPTLYGLFYEDINHAADGGIYAEMIQNRSFEEFSFDTYDGRSGENGASTGRVRNPMMYWFGEDIDKACACFEGGLNEYFGLEDKDANACFVEVKSGARLYNHGFCDNTLACAMNLKADVTYDFSIWAKPKQEASVAVVLKAADGTEVSDTVTIEFDKVGEWKKYFAQLTVKQSAIGKIKLVFTGDTAIDMVSLMPGDVWGAKEEASSATAHSNYEGNPNYRLRRDLVEALAEMHPKFLRFPGGCISEGSYIWDNVYDWKDSVGPVEVRKENYNVWGYTMTMGLGYMEYFQLAEDLNAEPLPVMACGVLCQARSDYANPAGGSLQEKYISNFVDLIDFAISTDFENNKWAALRKEMGHEAPFGLHYLGVGNENWGTEFFASFEVFKHAIDEHMKKYYPDYELHIISTVGAQADDVAYQKGWKFLAGGQKGTDRIRFTDGKESFEKEVSWYPHQKNYLDTIVDEHYYRANDYLLENADRYNYYYRPYKDGKLVEDQVSKVFVGEYASSDKNTHAGAIAEAAAMTGFEKNSDVVRLAATAPLFNKVGADGTYRWTPDAIWFDDTSLWRTPSYYVQQLFAKYIGTQLLDTTYRIYNHGEKETLVPRGGVTLCARGGRVKFERLKVVSNESGESLFEQDFSKELAPELKPMDGNENGYYINDRSWKDYSVEVAVKKIDRDAEIAVGVGLDMETFSDDSFDKASLFEYCVGKPWHGTGLRVIKEGKEGYTMGDYSNSVFAGNLRAYYDEPVAPGKYTVKIDFNGTTERLLRCYYTDESGERKGFLENKLESYIRDLYYSVTADEKNIYVKLVNADVYEKNCRMDIEGVKVALEAKKVVLTSDPAFVYTPNVNMKGLERVAPQYGEAKVDGQSIAVPIPAHTLVVLILEKE